MSGNLPEISLLVDDSAEAKPWYCHRIYTCDAFCRKLTSVKIAHFVQNSHIKPCKLVAGFRIGLVSTYQG